MNGIKHLIECQCILPQFKKRENPPYHKFVVFSIIDDVDEVLEKFAQSPMSCLERIEKLEQLRALEIGNKISVSIVQSATIGIDVPEDLLKLQKQSKYE